MANPTKEDALKGLENPMGPYLEAESIDGELLARKLKEELDAETTVFAKYRGKIDDHEDVTDWTIRQKARQDAHKLRGDYPAEKTEHSGRITLEEIIKAQEKEEENGKE